MQTIRKTFPWNVHTFKNCGLHISTLVQPIERLEQDFRAFKKLYFYSFGDANFGIDSNILGGSHMMQLKLIENIFLSITK